MVVLVQWSSVISRMEKRVETSTIIIVADSSFIPRCIEEKVATVIPRCIEEKMYRRENGGKSYNSKNAIFRNL